MNLEQLTQDVINGKESPYKAITILKDLEYTLKECYSKVKEEALKQAYLNGGGTFDIGDIKVEVRKGGKQFNYSNCNTWVELKNKLKECESKLKASYSAYEKGLTMVNDSAEIIEIPEVTYKSDSIICKIIK